MGERSKYIRSYVVDFDFSSMYPSIAIAFSISPATMVGKLFIPNKVIMDRYNAPEIAACKYDAGKDFMEGVLTQNYLMVGTRWFNLPTTDKIIEQFEKYFDLNRVNNLEINQKEIKAFRPEMLTIDID